MRFHLLSSLNRHVGSAVRPAQRYTSASHAASPVAVPDSPPPSTASPQQQLLPYFVPRNSKGSLPVYTDVRNAGTRRLVLIRNIQGDIKRLADDLSQSLVKPDSPHRLLIKVKGSRELVLSGGRWKHAATDWLMKKGF